jgi:hypothetical protein
MEGERGRILQYLKLQAQRYVRGGTHCRYICRSSIEARETVFFYGDMNDGQRTHRLPRLLIPT